MQKKINALDWLNQKIESRFVFGLDRMCDALKILDIKNNSTRVQILGTNGKGSTIEFLKNILTQHKKSVAVYTSPHLLSLYDRFKVNDQSIKEEVFIEYLDKLFDLEKNDQIPKLSYFELTTLLAYMYFSDCNVDFMLIEAGLGGRLDATSALPYDTLLFTSIDYDHKDYLGDTIKSIAFEKFSVIQKHHTVLSLNQKQEALEILQNIVQERSPKLLLEDNDFFHQASDKKIDFKFNDQSRLENIALGLKGKHQIHNALLATQTACLLLKESFENDLTLLALQKTQKPGRYQKLLSGNTEFILDVAHNQQSFLGLMETSQKEDSHIEAYCLSMLKDKPWKHVLTQLIEYKKPIYLSNTDSQRSWNKAEVLAWIKENFPDAPITFFDKPEYAIDHIKQKHKLCLLFGSFFFVGPCLSYITQSN